MDAKSIFDDDTTVEQYHKDNRLGILGNQCRHNSKPAALEKREATKTLCWFR
jgi:hypothetical protein